MEKLPCFLMREIRNSYHQIVLGINFFLLEVFEVLGTKIVKLKMIPCNPKLVLLLSIFLLPLITTHASKPCNRSCGVNGNQNRLPFPFGFSNDCEIHLNCSENGDILIGDYRVQRVTPENILIKLEAICNRSIQTLQQLYSPNYALTWHNGLLLRNCNSSENGCMLPTTLAETRFQLQGCDGKNDSINCFPNEGKKQGFMTFDKVMESRCDFFYSSIAVDFNKNSLDLGTIQLEWWLEGNCDECSPDASCSNFTSPVNRRPVFRCLCNEGFAGDGFKAGLGCRKVSSPSHCDASNYMSIRCGGTTRICVLIGGIIAGASTMAGLALLCYYIRRRSYFLKSQKSLRRLLSETAGGFSIPFYTYKEIERATNGFSENQMLGIGAYGTVYAGKLHNDEWVAIKKIRNRDTDGIEQVINEIKLLSSVSHPNLVRLLGFSIERGEQILVYEFMPNGTLSQHLQRERGIGHYEFMHSGTLSSHPPKERGTGLPWTIRLTIATETAQAIAHLHSALDPPIFHRDIKSSNILLDYNFNSRVADFGLSRLGMTELSHISTAPQGTPGYVDPQYHQNFHLSDKSDVYSFGVVLVEIITAMKVVDFSRRHSEVNLAALAVEKIGKGCVDEIIDPFLEPHRDAWTLSSVHKVAELAFRCLAFHRDMRPSMMEVADELELIRLSSWAPLEENISLASSVSSCSSPSNKSEQSLRVRDKKVKMGSPRLVVPERDGIVIPIEVKDSSPVSVQDQWISEQSSPSTTSLLGNVIQ